MKVSVYGVTIPFMVWFTRHEQEDGLLPPKGFGIVRYDICQYATLMAPWPFSFVMRWSYELYWRTAHPTKTSREKYIEKRCRDYHRMKLEEMDKLPRWLQQ